MGKFNKSAKSVKKSKLKTLDLHGKTIDQVYALVDKFIMQANKSGFPQVAIMTGKGTGGIKKEVEQYLKQASYPWKHELLPNGKPNTGVMIVFVD